MLSGTFVNALISSVSNLTPATPFLRPRAGQSISADRDWVPPDADALELTYAVTSSVVEQFAHGHTVSDVLRELVQNEYDGHGRSLSIEFSEEGLNVRGSGDSIDRAGWQRLSVMLGTGHVSGDDREVAPKTNGIGSKNHGLRSLFLIGDQIYVRSGGLQTLLDLRRGAPRQAIPDLSSPRRGVHIFVPYRTVRNGLLEPYGIEREARDLDIVRDQLAPTLMKLAQRRFARYSNSNGTIATERTRSRLESKGQEPRATPPWRADCPPRNRRSR